MNKVTKVLGISFVVNTILALAKIVVGVIGKSSALIADGFHSFSDLITDVIAIIGSKISRKPADKKHPYGHGRLEYVISAIIGFFVLFLGLSIIFNGTKTDYIVPSKIVIIVSIITIVSKLLLSNYILRKGHKFNNNILISSGLESRTDVISSIVVLVSAICMQLSNFVPLLKYTDMLACIVVGILIVRVAYGILRDNFSMVLGEQETNPLVLKKVTDIIMTYDEIRHIDCVNLLKYGSYYKLICEISMDSDISLLSAHNIVNKIEDKLKKKIKEINYITIHVNPYEQDNK